MILTDLCLDPYSRYRYLEKIAHAKTETTHALLKKIQSLKERYPQKYSIYM